MKIYKKYYIVLAILSIILAAGGPFDINELYKINDGYVVLWGVEDMLSYYGNLLGMVITISGLIVTIAFTRKQIAHERYLEYNYAKWQKPESIINKALEIITPLRLIEDNIRGDSLEESLHNIITSLNRYSLEAKTSMDMLKCYITPEQYSKVEPLVDKMSYAIKEFCKIEDDYKTQCFSIQKILIRDGKVSNVELENFINISGNIKERILPAHEGTYQLLLNMKRDTFDRIYLETENEAYQILLFKKI